MNFYADLHIHSKYSRATSRNLDLENLSYWGQKKGITVIGTGDFTHPGWQKELKSKLVPAEGGLFRLKPELERAVSEKLPPACRGEVRFLLSVEISTIYKKGDKTRKVHHLVYSPTFEQADQINASLSKIGNLKADGRPILGLDSRHLLEIVLEAGNDCFIIPAHIWTPWFSVLGSKSGFDRVEDCYGDLADHIFAVETGLSSDPEMNWRVSHLDKYRLVSNSDAHSPGKLGREASWFETDLDYFSMKRALETGKGYGGTVEFFPEEGKYHMDGHRKCEVRLSPEESKAHNGLCPVCKKPLTLGVLYRVNELADRAHNIKPEGASEYENLIPLPEMVSETLQMGVSSQKVENDYEKLLHNLGPELEILSEIPLDEIKRSASPLVTEAISRMRRGDVIRDPGYDGEYGAIRLFEKNELKQNPSSAVLFDFKQDSLEKQKTVPRKENTKKEKIMASENKQVDTSKKPFFPQDLIRELDKEQKIAAEIEEGALLIIAGPGSGKTRTLTHRIARLIQNGKALPKQCLTITFTRRAAEEMRARLEGLLPAQWKDIPVTTFHGLGLKLLQENRVLAGLPRGFRVAGEIERAALLKERLEWPERKIAKILKQLSLLKRKKEVPSPQTDEGQAWLLLENQRESEGLLDYDDLLLLSVRLLEENISLQSLYRDRYRWISIDEYQDIDEFQYRLIRLLADGNGNLCVIGDPDQAIYSFRGADVEFFLRFKNDFPAAKEIRLTKNYRSGESILSASSQMIAPTSLVEDREMQALLEDTGRVVIHQSPTDKAEAEFIVQTIEKLMGGISFFSLDSERSAGETEQAYSFSDIAVLYRTEALASSLEEALSRSGLPFQRQTHHRLDETPKVRTLLQKMRAMRSSVPLLQRLEDAYEELPASERSKKDPLLEKLKAAAERSNEKFEDFLSEICLGLESDLWDERADRLSLLTLHAAKGLEFPVVFIAGCEDGLLPLQWGGEPPEEKELAEERRLFYVGMTRAREKLFLSHAQKRFLNGKISERSPSPFLKNIEEKLLERSKSNFKKKAVAPSPQFELF